ncbi:MAG TPA: hypothetical protein VFU05_03445 [Cyclobacteriaceae bacterium]|nr:hypothetical protein [Cyclobacteriaceae bacterium]
MPLFFDRSFIVSVALVFYSSFTIGQISISSDGFQYTQDFSSLVSVGTDIAWVNGTTLDSWYATNASGYLVTYSAGTGTSGTTGVWSYGTNADRALGSIAQDASGDIAYGVLFENNSGVVINSIVLSLRAEQWRKVLTSTKGYQRVQVGYKIADNIDLTYTALLANSFTEVPEGYMISRDTVSTVSLPVDGNAVGNFANLTVTFPVSLSIGQQIFLRFYDSNVSGVDVALAVDDLQVTFSSAVINRITASSDYNFFPYMDMGMLEDIPPAGVGYSYIVPTPDGLDSLTTILQDFYSLDWNSLKANISATNYDYQAVEFFDQVNNKRYYVLRKNTLSSHFWGTIALADDPADSVLVIQAPHPLKDSYTETQGAAVFEFSGARAYMVAGISRCASDIGTSCVPGSPDICGAPFIYRKSDVAHNTDCMFHLATTLLADSDPSTVFVQLHGFGDGYPDDPDFIVSPGTMNAMDKSVPDYAVELREEILNINSSWNAKVVHADNYDELAGTNNVQGRYVNNYTSDACTGTDEPELVTNRFLHIEQYRAVRQYATYYQPFANALANVINDNAYTRHIPVTAVPFQYTQNFNFFATSSSALTWGNNLSKPGWYAAQSATGLFSYYHFDDGSSSEGGLYSFGNSVSDRSLGSLNDAANIAYGALFKNTSGANINFISLEYDAKQWKKATNTALPQKVTFSYRVASAIDVSPRKLLDNSIFTSVVSGDMLTIDNSSGNQAVDGDATLTHVTTSIPVLLAPNDEIFFRFYDADETGADRAMALDNFNVTFSYDALLPMDWVSFNIQRSEGYPLLKWVTANEVNCDRYEVMRSVNGHDFEKIATQSCLQKKDNNQYEFLDTQNTIAHTLYYRILQYDLDNQFSSSKTLLYHPVQSLQPKLWMENNALHISVNSKSELLGVAVFDMLGRNLYSGKPPAISGTNYVLELNEVLNQVLVVKCIFNNFIQTSKIIAIR